MTEPWPMLRERYDLVRELYVQQYPDESVPPFPGRGDPNQAIMVIDQMLARMEEREPLVIRAGSAYKAYTSKDPDA